MELNKIYKMDCLVGMKEIPNSFIDCVVTSPPYNKMESKNGGRLTPSVIYDIYTDARDEDDYQQNQIAVLNELSRIIKPDGSIFYNHKNRYIDGRFISPLEWISKTDLEIRQEIVWDRCIASNLRGWRFWQTDERIYWLQRKGAKSEELQMEYAQFGSVWQISPNREKNGHPCPFPERISDRCIASTCREGGIVLDPYMGSGTVAVSAIKSKCNFIGFDVSDEYIKIANLRIRQAMSNLTLL